jgi:hypothetical protein
LAPTLPIYMHHYMDEDDSANRPPEGMLTVPSERSRNNNDDTTDSKESSVLSRIVATSARNPSVTDNSKDALSQDSKDSRRKRPEQERCRILRGFGEGLCDATSVGTNHGIPMCDTHLERYKKLKQEKEKKPHLKRP